MMRRVPHRKCFTVRRKGKGRGAIKSRCTTKKRAQAQMRLLYALDRPGFRLRS
jgi:hypothetical protein